MSTTKIIGLILMIAGAAIAFYGFQMSESVSAQVTKSVTGSFSDKVMWHFVGGAVAFVAGVLILKK